MSNMTPGIYPDIDIIDYHKDKSWFSSTGLRKAKKSLKLFNLYLQGYFDDEYKPCFSFGNAFELALLDRLNFSSKVAIDGGIIKEINDFRPEVTKPRSTNEYKTWFQSQESKNKYIIHSDGQESYRCIEEMLRSCLSDAVIRKLIEGIEYNYSIYWKDNLTGLQLKTRPDICKTKKNIIVSLKTTVDGSPEAFSRDLVKYDYPFQACMEIDGVLASGFMSSVDNYYWLVVEKVPPFSATIYEFMPEDVDYCMDEYQYTLKIVKEAIDTNIFPSYSQRASNKYGILEARIPLYYRNFGL